MYVYTTWQSENRDTLQRVKEKYLKGGFSFERILPVPEIFFHDDFRGIHQDILYLSLYSEASGTRSRLRRCHPDFFLREFESPEEMVSKLAEKYGVEAAQPYRDYLDVVSQGGCLCCNAEEWKQIQWGSSSVPEKLIIRDIVEKDGGFQFTTRYWITEDGYGPLKILRKISAEFPDLRVLQYVRISPITTPYIRKSEIVCGEEYATFPYLGSIDQREIGRGRLLEIELN